MASIRAIAQEILPDARAEIAWIAFYKKGRGWGAQCFFPDFDDQSGTFTFDTDDTEWIEEILSIDENAIFVNPYYSNLGPSAEEGMTRETLANGLRWQYDLQSSLLRDAWQDRAQPEPETVKVGDYINTPRFCTVKIAEVFASEAEAHSHGYSISSYYRGDDCTIWGKSLDLYHMRFAAVPKPQARSA